MVNNERTFRLGEEISFKNVNMFCLYKGEYLPIEGDFLMARQNIISGYA